MTIAGLTKFSNKGVTNRPIFISFNLKTSTVLIANEIVSSKTDWRRLVEDKAVSSVDGVTILDVKEKAYNVTLKIGKKRFVKIIETYQR